ncbi:PRAME family member 20-like [Cavia porcellus]|uniref:PRAME family member 20-like n=1 Tax=Cavia porcellus TaxID=10141 RepID=UPI00022B5A33|nr:PRAME family member 20-like [Cavia porcellus]XP_013009230.1 PRAME family member 20-like [Cavia porcellus]
MSTQFPHRLQKLATQSLLTEKALAIWAMEDLPGELFPPVFVEAFNRGHAELLKAMVLSWPFPYLPLGALISIWKPRKLNTQVDVDWVQNRMLQAVLAGLNVLLSQKLGSSRRKLQVLDMRDVHQDFWRVWAENQLEACSSEVRRKTKTEKTLPRVAKKQPLKVILHLWLSEFGMDPFLISLLQWVQKREGLVQLECTSLRITSRCFQKITQVLESLNLDSVQHVDVGRWELSTLAHFAPYLGQMQNLHTLMLSDISMPDIISPEKTEQMNSQITSQFMKLHCLQEVYVDSLFFLEGHLDQVLRCLMSPLETLQLSYCWLSDSDWNQLPHCPSIRHLKHLALYGLDLTRKLDPLRFLLENIGATLITLHLQVCGIMEVEFLDFLPALSYCSQLTTFSYMRNSMSLASLESLLCHTARLSNLTLELYSRPEEV